MKKLFLLLLLSSSVFAQHKNIIFSTIPTLQGANTFEGNIAVAGDVIIPAVNNRSIGIYGQNSGMTNNLYLGDVTNSLFRATFGQAIIGHFFHGSVFENDASGNSPALRVNGYSSGQPVITLYKSNTTVVGSFEQDGRFRNIHLDATLSGTPTATTAVALGTGGTIAIRAGDGDGAHQVTVVAGSSGMTANQIAQVAFAGLPYTRAPIVSISNVYNMPAGLAVNSSSTTGYTLHPGTVALSAGYTFVINVLVSQ